MSLVLQSSGGGSVTLAEPTTASNFTQTLPAADGTVAIADGSGNLSVTGNLSFNSGYGSSAIAYGCRAWVNFNGTGTVAIRASGNVSSITDNGIGDYTINIANALVDSNYSGYVSVFNTAGSDIGIFKNGTFTTTSISLITVATSTNSIADVAGVFVAVFR
jgi:hypothetical protein